MGPHCVELLLDTGDSDLRTWELWKGRQKDHGEDCNLLQLSLRALANSGASIENQESHTHARAHVITINAERANSSDCMNCYVKILLDWHLQGWVATSVILMAEIITSI